MAARQRYNLMSIAKLFVEVGANVNGFQRGMNQVNQEIDHTAKKAGFFANTMSTALGVGLTNIATKAVSSLMNIGKAVVDTGINFNNLEQNSTLAFETMLGSMEQAKSFLGDLKTFAKTTPFELPGLIDSSQRLLAFGFQAKQIIPMMTNIGDAVAGLGGSPEKLNRVILAFGQIKAKGRVMAGEMMQLTEAGIPAWDMLAKKIGVSIPEAMKLGEKGLIDADTAITGILEGMNAKFGGLMSKQAKSWSGMMSNIKDTFTQVTGRVMKPFFELGLKGMEKLLKLFDSPVFEVFVQRATKASQFVANVIGNIGSKLFNFNFKNLFLDFDKLSSLLGKYENKRFGWLSNFTPKEAITSIKGFINELKYGGVNLQYWIDHMPRLFQPIAKISIKAVEMWKYLAGGGIRDVLKKLGSILVGLGSTLAKLVRPFKEALGGLFQQLTTMKNLGFADIFKAVLSSIAKALMGFIDVIKAEFWPTIKAALIWVWDSLYSFASGIDWSAVWSGIVTGFNAIVDFVKSIDWSGIWNTVVSVFSAIGEFLKQTVFPALGDFFDWLLSWFTDPSKSQMLWNAVTSVWTFLTDWASYIWDGVSPYLSSFFGWLTSWFTDPAKSQQILNSLVTVWNFVSEWASYLWNWVSPYLSSFWSNLLEWANSVAVPNLSKWSVAFVSWSVNLWKDYLQPKMVSWWKSFEGWMIATFPSTQIPLANLRTNFINFFDQLLLLFGVRNSSLNKDWSKIWTDFFDISKLNLDKFLANVIQLGANFIGALESVVYLFRNIVNGNWTAVWDELKRIATNTWQFLKDNFNFDGPDSQAIINGVKSVGQAIYDGFMNPLKGIAEGFKNYVINPIKHAINEIVKGYNSLSSLGLGTSTISEPFPGFATGGNIGKSGSYLVGEKGPEVVDLPGGARVWDHGQSMGKDGGSNTNITITLNNNSAHAADRSFIKEIATALQRELNLQGNRVVFAS
jgi:tape measure domain-containing protein